MTPNASHLRHLVTAVVVAHDGARLLPAVLHAVRDQTHPVRRVVGVDTGSSDRSGALLTELLGPDAVFGMDPGTGYGEAVGRALHHDAAHTPLADLGQDQDQPMQWVWLLHDDCEPAADALEQLLRAADRGRQTAVLGPKLKDLTNRRVLREAGVTIDRAGRRFTGIEPGEIDQGQHDGNRSVLAVSSAGMLVRRDVWDQLGGFDPNLPLFRDDIDFCWRAHAAGYEVRVVTDAVVYHRESSARQIRKAPAGGGHPRLLDRRSALYVFAVNLPLRPMLSVVGGCLAGSVLRAVYFLLTKQQRKAAAHLGSVAWLLRHPLLLWRARQRRAADRRHGYAVLRGQLPPGHTLGRLVERLANLLSRGSGYDSGGLHHAVVDTPSDDLPLPATDSKTRRVLTSPGVLMFAGLLLVGLVAERSVVGPAFSGSGTLSGGALAPAWGGASDLWHEYLAGYHGAGLGSSASAPPYLGVLAVLATLLAGKPWLAVDVLLFGCVPAAGVTAFLAAKRLTGALPARLWIAASYALLPVAMGTVAAGRLGTAAAFVLLPLVGIAVARLATGPPRAARRASWAAGLLIAFAAAFVPLVWALAVAAALGAAAAWRWLGRRIVLNAVIAAAAPAVLLLPWTFHLVAHPRLFVGEVGLVRPGLSAAGLKPGTLLLLSPGGPGLPPAWVTAGLLLPAFAALATRRRTGLVFTGWTVALGGLIAALVVSRVRLTPTGPGSSVNAWPGIAMAIAAAGLLMAATPLIEAAARRGGRGRRSWRSLVMLTGFAVAASAPVLAAGWWLVSGVSGPLGPAKPQILPPFVAAASAGPAQSRTLVLRPDGAGLSYAVLRATDPILGQPELAEDPPATHALDGVVASLESAGGGDTADTGQALSGFDIRYVLLPAPIDQTLAGQLDGAAGLEPLTNGPGYDLWQVAGPVARVRVVTASGTVALSSGAVGANTIIPPGTSGTLVLAEPAGGWSATLNGRPLARVTQPVDGWAQGFVLPPGGGRLVIARNQVARAASLAGQAAALFLVLVLALPGILSAAAEPDGTRPASAGADDTGQVPAEPADTAAGPARTLPRPARRRREPAENVDAVIPVAATPVPGTEASDGDARRSRGQHAARHGKPSSRRRRESPADIPPPEEPERSEEPVSMSLGEPGSSGSSGPRPPWELGDPT